MMTYNVTR